MCIDKVLLPQHKIFIDFDFVKIGSEPLWKHYYGSAEYAIKQINDND